MLSNPRLFLIFFIIIYAANVIALECDDSPGESEVINLRSKGKPFEKFKTYNQGTIGSCANNTLGAAMYAEFGVEVSANHLHVINYNKEKVKNKILGGTFPCTSFKRAKSHNRICSTRSVFLDQVTNNGIDTALQSLGFLFSSLSGEEHASKYTREEVVEKIKMIREHLESKDNCSKIGRAHV